MLTGKLSSEATDGRYYGDEVDDSNPAKAGEYKVILRTVDPSGETDTQVVTITANPENDLPVISGRHEISVDEQDEGDPDSYTGAPDMPQRTAPPTMEEIEANTHLRANSYTASDEDASLTRPRGA